MTRDVLISITGAQISENGPQEVEMMTVGDYFGKNGKHYLMYEELLEDGSGSIKNTIRIEPDVLSITKKGVASTQMVFEKDKKNLACYMTPFGQMMIGLHTRDLRVEEEEELIRVEVDYALDINYEHVSDCNITVAVRPRGAGETARSAQ